MLLCETAHAADHPGTKHLILPADLPKPYLTPAVDNSSSSIARPKGVIPEAPKGFSVVPFVTGLANARFSALTGQPAQPAAPETR